jgi:exonuclease VII large subunit
VRYSALTPPHDDWESSLYASSRGNMTTELDALLSLQAQLETKLAAARTKYQAEFARLDRQTETQYSKIRADIDWAEAEVRRIEEQLQDVWRKLYQRADELPPA